MLKLKFWPVASFITIAFAALFFFQKEADKILAQRPTAWELDHFSDCAIVLTGGRGRVREGFDLLTQKRIKKLIISGVYPGSTLREIFPQWPFYGAIEESDVILEKRSRTTFGNAQQSLPLAEALKCRDITLITSRLHMYRAYRIFRSVFPPEYPIYPRAIVGRRLEPHWSSQLIEVIKSLFYSLWAY